jgi:hypothetical protein
MKINNQIIHAIFHESRVETIDQSYLSKIVDLHEIESIKANPEKIYKIDEKNFEFSGEIYEF